MAKIKFDNSNIEDVLDNIPVGLYRFRVAEIEDGKSESSGNRRLAVTLECQSKADGSKADCKGMNAWIYPQPPQPDQHPYVAAQWKQFCVAVGLGEKGTLDTDKLVGTIVLGQVKLDRKSDEPDRTRVTKVMALPAGTEDDEDEDDGDDEFDVDTATAKELKAYIKENDLDVDAKLPLKKLRAAVEEALEGGDDDDDDEDDDDDAVDLDELSVKELKAFIKEHDLDVKVKKGDDADDIRAKIAEAADEDDDDDDDDDDEGDDYDEWSVEDLKNELKSRNLKTSGKADQLRQRLRKDDEDDAF